MIRMIHANVEVISGGAGREYAYVSFPSLFSKKSADLLESIIRYPIELYDESKEAYRLPIGNTTTRGEVRNLVVNVFEKFTPWHFRSNSCTVTSKVWLKSKNVFRNELGELMLFIKTSGNEIEKWWPAECNALMFEQFGVMNSWDYRVNVTEDEMKEFKTLFAKLINLYNADHPDMTDELIPIRKAIFSNEQIETPPNPFVIGMLNNALNEYSRFTRAPKDYRDFHYWGWMDAFKKDPTDKRYQKIVTEEYDRIMNLNF